ncbi:hypothetical protein Mesil_3559 (plasmid) [Allomeiothermus silvanus DSM 9946]|uniref:Uncharacterized protein n=2 Tax=Allomeiothermus silvanus TaxID=52022 RepID=D7BJJ6_ALLS1|nr:hypothetical protein Mesil_3559 [Allomeiothermus silvanus DSM 9946]
MRRPVRRSAPGFTLKEMSEPSADLPTLSELSGFTERSLRRGVAAIHQRGGDLRLEGQRVRGADLPCFLATLYDLSARFERGHAPPIADHFAWMREQPKERWRIPPEWPCGEARDTDTAIPPVPVPDLRGADLEGLRQTVQGLAVRLDRLEALVTPLVERFNRVDKALRHIELVLEDEDADNNLYNILVSHIGGFNERLSSLEQHLSQLTRTVAGGMVKFADDDREIKNLLRELLRYVSPR